MVVRVKVQGTENAFVEGNPFKYKVILLVEKTGGSAPSLRGFYESTRPDPSVSPAVEGSNTLLYIKGGDINNSEFGPVDYFRGLVYVEPGGLNMRAKNSFIEGAVYHADGARHKYDNFANPNVMDITYDEDVILEFNELGIFTDPNEANSSTTTTELEIVPGRYLTMELVSQSH